MNHEPEVVVHGGAWAIPDYLVEASRQGTRQAAQAAWDVLKAGGTALDAVEAAVRVLEDDPAFDAGKGSVLTSSGDIQMDAIIMDGSTLRAGAVACVHHVSNPVSLARSVMDNTDHCLLVGAGADQYAVEAGFPVVRKEDLLTEEAQREYDLYKEYKSSVKGLFNGTAEAKPLGHDTVGAVARDVHGHVAATTSTGGITAQRPGRVGAVAGIGAGAYADDEVGAASCTGHGESMLKVCLAKTVLDYVRKGLDLESSARQSLDYMQRRVGGRGGIILLPRNGEGHAAVFSTERMAWAAVAKDQLSSGLEPGECFQHC